jgi:hypothetical protein
MGLAGVGNGKMTVEAAMRERGCLHDVDNADAVKPLGAKQDARRIDDALAVCRGLLPSLSWRSSVMRRAILCR